MKNIAILLFSIVLLNACKASQTLDSTIKYESYITQGNQSMLLSNQKNLISATSDATQIVVEADKKFQEIDGFGFTLTEGSAWAIHQKLDEKTQNEVLNELFATDQMNFSFIRLSLGASDMNHFVYTYDDLLDNETDLNLAKFSLAEDQKDIIPVLKKIIAINPKIKIMASPWTAPKWMKTNNSFIGGKLKPENYKVYAQYFVKYIEAMKNEGINIYAITIQNEPENPKNNPSMEMTADEQANFIANNLGPAFEAANIKTKIILFDHNCDHPVYPISILNNQDARKYVDGSAFHLYAGDISALSTVQAAHPDKNLYFTEQWNWTKGKFAGDLVWGVKNLLIGATRNWSRTVLQWNLSSNQNYEPFTPNGGCSECLPAFIVMDNGTINRNVAYYTLGHGSKFITAGSIRIGSSNSANGFSNVAFVRPDGQRVVVVLNENTTKKTFKIIDNNNSFFSELEGGAVGTYIWK